MKLDLQIVHTGQHYDYDMSRVFLDQLRLPDPSFNLNVGSGTHAWQTGEIMKRLETLLQKVRPHCVLVPGDTNSTLAAALAAAKMGIPVAHLEAGARSYDMTMPEEINRVLTDHCSSILFAPTLNCRRNLLAEGIAPSRILMRGDTHFDAFRTYLHRIRRSDLRESLPIEGRFAYATIHRPENVDNDRNLREICRAFVKVSSGLPLVFSVHPRTNRRIREIGVLRRLRKSPRVKLLSPVTYMESLALAHASSLVITDSGGLQREAFWLRRPCLVVRRTTEWPETMVKRTVLLSSPKSATIVRRVYELLRLGNLTLRKPSSIIIRDSPFGDGHAATKIVRDLEQHLQERSSRPRGKGCVA
jgi:UDP-N-acetylglucosamine 2-epimerase